MKCTPEPGYDYWLRYQGEMSYYRTRASRDAYCALMLESCRSLGGPWEEDAQDTCAGEVTHRALLVDEGGEYRLAPIARKEGDA